MILGSRRERDYLSGVPVQSTRIEQPYWAVQQARIQVGVDQGRCGYKPARWKKQKRSSVNLEALELRAEEPDPLAGIFEEEVRGEVILKFQGSKQVVPTILTEL